MSLIQQVYASGGDVIISTLELTCPAWGFYPIAICSGFEDQTVTDENGRTLTFQGAGISIALPKKNTQGAQTLTFAIDNVTGEAQRLIDMALDAGEQITMNYRVFLASDLSAPAEGPLVFKVKDGKMQNTTVEINAGFFDMINTGWPRDLYTAEFAPGLKYF